MNFVWFWYVAERDAIHARGCRATPPGAPLHPERKTTLFGGLWWRLMSFGMMSVGGVSMEIIRRSTHMKNFRVRRRVAARTCLL